VAWLWGSGVTATTEEARALDTLLRQAHISERVNAGSVGNPAFGWQERTQPRTDYPQGWPVDTYTPVGSQRWELEAHLGSGALALAVDRTDVYQPFAHAQEYKLPASGPQHTRPFFHTAVRRTVNGQPILQWNEGEDAYRVRGFAPDQIFEPHRAGGCKQVFTEQPVSDNAAQA